MINHHTRHIYSTLNGNGSNGIHADVDVIESWRRCIDNYGLEPDQTSAPNILDASKFKQVSDSLEDLLIAATPEMERLFSFLSGNHYFVTLTAQNGVMLDFLVSAELEEICREFSLIPGSVWNEDVHGTNGISTCLQTQTSLTILKQEHFFTSYTGLTCSTAPIFNGDASLCAVLNVTTPTETNHMAQALVRKIVESSAKKIQYNLFRRRYAEHPILRLSHFADFADVTVEGLVAIDGDGIVLASEICGKEASALSSFNISAGQSITDVFGESFDPSEIERARDSVLRINHGRELSSNLFVKIYCPTNTRTAAAKAASFASGMRSTRILKQFTPELQAVCGNDAKMTRNAEIALKVVNLDIPILLLGETGTGKGLFAQAIHNASDRKDKPFVAVNCAAIPENLIESELFGYRPGAFTGAGSKGYKGKIMEANGGTLFLDEIGDMPTPLQTRLLRVLSEGEIVPLGGDKKVQLDVHVVSATLKDLPKMIADGTFREDLYFRLNGASLQLPALRERTDIKTIISRILDEAFQAHGLEVAISASLLSYLQGYFWPGNIRELKNALRYAIAMCEGDVLKKSHLPPQMHSIEASEAGHETGDGEEKEITLLALKQENWNVSAAARMLGISRATLHRRIKQYGLSRSTQ